MYVLAIVSIAISNREFNYPIGILDCTLFISV